MAFVQDTPRPDVGSSGVVTPGDTSGVAKLGAIEQAVSFAGDFLSAAAGQGRKIRTDEVLGSAVGGINDLLEEREGALAVERDVSRQLTEITSDTEITDEERQSLVEIEQSRKFLKEARATGILSTHGFSTRMNSLRRSVLARAENLGIQTNIEELFLQGQSLQEEPPEDPTLAAVRSEMDKLHGANNWTVDQAADFVANEAKFQTAVRNVNSTISDLTFAMRHQMEKVIQTKRRDTEKGALFTAQDGIDIVSAAQDQALGILDIISAQEKQLKATGRMTPGLREELNAKKLNILEIRDGYTSMITGDKSVPEYFSTNEVFERADKTLNLFVKMNMPMTARAMQNMAGNNGSNSALSSDIVFSLFDPESSNIKVWERIASTDPLGRSALQIREQEFQKIGAWINGNISIDRLVGMGVINPAVQQMLALSTIKRPQRTGEETISSIDIQKATLSPLPNNAKGNGDKLAILSQSFEDGLSKATSNGKRNEYLSFHKDKFEEHVSELSAFLKKKTGFQMLVTGDGRISIPQLRPEAVGIPGFSERPNETISKVAQVFASYSDQLIKAGVITPQDLINALNPDQKPATPEALVGVDAFTGAAIKARKVEEDGEAGAEQGKVRIRRYNPETRSFEEVEE